MAMSGQYLAVGARNEDKWLEFVATEFSARSRHLSHKARAAACVKRVEVQASYWWLFAGAIVAWWIS
jgi:hypothetical protein